MEQPGGAQVGTAVNSGSPKASEPVHHRRDDDHDSRGSDDSAGGIDHDDGGATSAASGPGAVVRADRWACPDMQVDTETVFVFDGDLVAVTKTEPSRVHRFDGPGSKTLWRLRNG